MNMLTASSHTTFSGRFWEALSSALVAALTAGLLFSSPASGQVSGYVSQIDAAAAKTKIAATMEVKSSSVGASDARASTSRWRVPSVQDVPALGRIISVQLSGVSLERALHDVAGRAGLKLAYLQETLATGRTVTLKAEAVSVREVLSMALRETHLRLVRASEDQLVLTGRPALRKAKVHDPRQTSTRVSARPTMTLGRLSAAKKQGTITGTVTDSTTGEPLPGVNVAIVGTQQGTATNVSGGYTIAGVEPGTYTLQASFVGYASKTVEGVEVSDGETATVDIAIRPSTVALEDVVVTALGVEQEERSLTYSTEAVSADQLAEARELNVTSSLQGKVAGLSVSQGGFGLGSDTKVLLRGNCSFNSSDDPLYVVDGVPINGNISNMSPDIIQNITDASEEEIEAYVSSSNTPVVVGDDYDTPR